MLKRIGVALPAIALLLPFTAAAQKSGRSSRSPSSKKAVQRVHGSRLFRRDPPSPNGQNGRINRSASARADFMKQTGYPKGRKG